MEWSCLLERAKCVWVFLFLFVRFSVFTVSARGESLWMTYFYFVFEKCTCWPPEGACCATDGWCSASDQYLVTKEESLLLYKYNKPEQ